MNLSWIRRSWCTSSCGETSGLPRCKALLAKEKVFRKELTPGARLDAGCWVKVDKTDGFERPASEEALGRPVRGRSQLLV
jgi:hypothetical protein